MACPLDGDARCVEAVGNEEAYKPARSWETEDNPSIPIGAVSDMEFKMCIFNCNDIGQYDGPLLAPSDLMKKGIKCINRHFKVTYDSSGTLSGNTITGTPAKVEDWTLDALGNWPAYVTKASGTTDLNQTRTSSAVNEVIDITETVGTSWSTRHTTSQAT